MPDGTPHFYVLVDARTGRVTELEDFPWFSPDGARFVTVNGDDPFMGNGVELWRISPSWPKRELRYESHRAVGHRFKRWIDAQHVALRGMRARGEGETPEEFVPERFEATLLRAGERRIIKRNGS